MTPSIEENIVADPEEVTFTENQKNMGREAKQCAAEMDQIVFMAIYV